MDDRDKTEYIRRYEERLRETGYSPETLGWGRHGRQSIRFSVLAEAVLYEPRASVLDVGCGFADLYDFLVSRGWRGRYTGVDLVPGLLETARQRHPGLDVRQLDITTGSAELTPHDYVIASGIANARLENSDNSAHIQQLLASMFALADRCVCMDFLSTYVDFQKPEAWHTDPHWAMETARGLSRRFTLRCDYMPYEFALLIYRDDAVSERNVFQQFEQKQHD